MEVTARTTPGTPGPWSAPRAGGKDDTMTAQTAKHAYRVLVNAHHYSDLSDPAGLVVGIAPAEVDLAAARIPVAARDPAVGKTIVREPCPGF